MTAIKAKLDAMMNKLGSNKRRMHIAHEVGAVDEGERRRKNEKEERVLKRDQTIRVPTRLRRHNVMTRTK